VTYITKYLPKLEDLKKQLESNPDNIKHYLKYEGFNGDSDSMDYLDEQIKSYLNKRNDKTGTNLR
jgi:hypothetical protein